MATVPSVPLNNGRAMPALGLGTWLAQHGTTESIKTAIDAGYRHIDTALVYQNEQAIGQAVREKIADGTVAREDMFIVSKLWNTYHRPDLVEKGCRKTLKNLGLEYLDLYLIHWPNAFQATDRADDESKEHKDLDSIMNDQEFIPVDASGQILCSDDDYVDTWTAMEELVEKGLVRSIGISNFNARQTERLIKTAKIKPVTNQVEVHPYLNQSKLIAFCKQRDIVVTGYSPLGSQSPSPKPGVPRLVEHPKLIELGKSLGKTPAQIVLRYHVQKGVVPIPKSTNEKRMKENLDIFDFELNVSQMSAIDELDCNNRYCIMKGTENGPNFPFNDEF